MVLAGAIGEDFMEKSDGLARWWEGHTVPDVVAV